MLTLVVQLLFGQELMAVGCKDLSGQLSWKDLRPTVPSSFAADDVSHMKNNVKHALESTSEPEDHEWPLFLLTTAGNI